MKKLIIFLLLSFPSYSMLKSHTCSMKITISAIKNIYVGYTLEQLHNIIDLRTACYDVIKNWKNDVIELSIPISEDSRNVLITIRDNYITNIKCYSINEKPSDARSCNFEKDSKEWEAETIIDEQFRYSKILGRTR